MKTAASEDLDTLINNVRSLMKAAKMKTPTLAKKSGISSRMIKYILNKERVPTVDTTQRLASAFGLKSWHLMIPDVNVESLKAQQVDSLVRNYTHASDKGKEYLEHVAEQEAAYGKKKSL